MNEADELSAPQLAQLRAALVELQGELLQGLRDSETEAAPVSLDEPIGRLSRMDAIAQREINQAGRRQAQQTLSQVRAALASLDRDEYGLCRSCEEPISFRRLKARPYAPICLPCQTAREAKK